jgi:membrane-bound serine protease (ClpP class)
VAIVTALALASPAGAAESPRVLAIELTGDVNPVTAGFVDDGIDRAERDGYDAVVILLDTPGGLAESMRDIVKRELAATVPVIVYVAPDGARAASAGVWIGQAADLLAMAPQTNIGSSTPIQLGGEDIQADLRRKVVNDAAASLRSLAESHGRNVEWADRAVRQASNLTAREALDGNVIDAVAPSLPALLDQVDGTRTVPKALVLHTAGAQVTTVEMSLWDRILDVLVDPNIIVLLLSLGVLAITVELFNPGLVFPAAFGAISLIVGFFGLQVLPFSWAGILLLLVAFTFFAAELFVTSHGALAAAGAVAFAFGALLLFDPAGDAYRVSLPLAIGLAAALALFIGFALAKAAAARRAPVRVGPDDLVGQSGIVRRWLDPEGLVFVRGELWRARAANGEQVPVGSVVRVVAVGEGLLLEVEAAGETPSGGRPEAEAVDGRARVRA